MVLFCGAVCLVVLMVFFFEGGVLPSGGLVSDDKSLEFVLVSFMELTTLCLIPLALRMFKMKRVNNRLTTPEALAKWGTVRLLMLCVPMVVNCLLYYLFYNVALGYMSIILFLCLFFVVPTTERCRAEIGMGE